MMKKQTKKVLTLIRQTIKSFIRKQEVHDWMESDDARYTDLVDEYARQLSEHWQKTRDDYIGKTIEKALDVDESVPHYDEEQLDSSPYIDGALAILANAFGAAVIVGYQELIDRGHSVDIPTNLQGLFDEAGEIRKYAWTALSNEQVQMDEIFTTYNNTENAKEQITDWFDKNEYRLTDLIIGGLIWYGINFGFTRATLEQTGEEELLIYWLTEKDKNVCEDCMALEAGNPYSKKKPLHTLPGGGKTICGSRCRCVVDTKEREKI